MPERTDRGKRRRRRQDGLARPPHMRRTDWLLVIAAIALAAGAVAVSVAVGSWTFLFG